MSFEISKRIEDNSYTVGVIGLGYVGIPLALGFADKGIRVIGFDIDEKKISLLSEGNSYLEHISSDHIVNHVIYNLIKSISTLNNCINIPIIDNNLCSAVICSIH